MAIPFLKVSPEEALESLQEYIRKGYELRYRMQDEYHKATPPLSGKLLDKWSQEINGWVSDTAEELKRIFKADLYYYNFLDVSVSAVSIVGENADFSARKKGLQSRIAVLRDYHGFILQHSNPTLTVEGDMILQVGHNPKAEIKK